jgi:hypothetical protein
MELEMKVRKNTQMSLINLKRAGRPAKIDKGIRHISREKITKASALHLTIKVRENKADIQSKFILKGLHRAIFRARLKGLKVIHYTLEFNHVHLVVEVSDNRVLHKGMQALGITFSKAVNRIKKVKGGVYKHRYHFRKLNSRREFKNALLYVFGNGMKHKRANNILDPYNSLVADKRIKADMHRTIERSDFLKRLRGEIREVLDLGKVFYLDVGYLWE